MRLAILGASGHGKVVADTAGLAGWDEVVFFDDAWPKLAQNGPWVVAGDTATLLKDLKSFDGIVVAVGNNQIRRNKQRGLAVSGGRIVSVVHPSASVSQYSAIGAGSVIFANAVVNADAEVGEGCIVNTGAVVEHDCFLGDFSHVSPNAVLAGGVKVGLLAWVGGCSSVRQLIEVGEGAVVGMGAVVTKNVPPGVTVVGNPARVIESCKG
ncbi:acetyltransferase [Marinobacter nauticus]|uniref:4-amino-6-deoxy-N-Acetyl-D-hexosaminyl-(Lipid carrier) acetyltrasferase n=1 Tax=Marinobacter nauticus TaxID=2743 RepID=A0A833JLR7_MARNT|nr:acetyltransferase [Marinobacter nauticus]KAE8544167.1 4-amino-6-deoxy-N-Acetyl-D-hexosaminyl-(Lipid carrier) acetyltrasferase [Marinobacter nauticus]